jgi:hypothetical protein
MSARLASEHFDIDHDSNGRVMTEFALTWRPPQHVDAVTFAEGLSMTELADRLRMPIHASAVTR